MGRRCLSEPVGLERGAIKLDAVPGLLEGLERPVAHAHRPREHTELAERATSYVLDDMCVRYREEQLTAQLEEEVRGHRSAVGRREAQRCLARE
jgi:hypothetical protein